MLSHSDRCSLPAGDIRHNEPHFNASPKVENIQIYTFEGLTGLAHLKGKKDVFYMTYTDGRMYTGSHLSPRIEILYRQKLMTAELRSYSDKIL